MIVKLLWNALKQFAECVLPDALSDLVEKLHVMMYIVTETKQFELAKVNECLNDVLHH